MKCTWEENGIHDSNVKLQLFVQFIKRMLVFILYLRATTLNRSQLDKL
jgi:hypothetical protein